MKKISTAFYLLSNRRKWNDYDIGYFDEHIDITFIGIPGWEALKCKEYWKKE